MRKRPLLIALLVVAILAGFVAYRQAGRAPTHTSLKTFVRDLKIARDISGVRYERYAYQLSKYSEEALRGMPWQEVLDSLRAQGAEFDDYDHNPTLAVAKFPECDLKLPSGLVLRPVIVLREQLKVDPLARTWIGCTPQANLELELKREYGKFSSKDLPPGSLLRQIFDRPGVAGVAAKFPWVIRGLLSYRGGGPGSAGYSPFLSTGKPGQAFLVTIECAKEEKGSQYDTVMAFDAPSEIEPAPRRVISWLPINISLSGKDFLAITGNDNVALMNGGPTNYFALQKISTRPPKQDGPTAYSNPDLAALPISTEKLFMDYSARAINYALLKRFPRLKELRLAQIKLTKSDVATIASLPSLTSLEATVTDRADLAAFVRMPNLTRLYVTYPAAKGADFALVCANPRIKKFGIWGIPDVDDKMLAEFQQLPRIRSTQWRYDSKVTMTGFQAIIDAHRYRRLDISMNMLPKDAANRLAEITTLEELSLSNATVTEETLRRLAALPKLKKIMFSSVRGITDAGLLPFAQNKQLDLISIADCPGVTPSGFRALKAKLGEGYRGPFEVAR